MFNAAKDVMLHYADTVKITIDDVKRYYLMVMFVSKIIFC